MFFPTAVLGRVSEYCVPPPSAVHRGVDINWGFFPHWAALGGHTQHFDRAPQQLEEHMWETEYFEYRNMTVVWELTFLIPWAPTAAQCLDRMFTVMG